MWNGVKADVIYNHPLQRIIRKSRARSARLFVNEVSIE
jgi:hypothetical protein